MFDGLSPAETQALLLSLRVSFWATLASLPLGLLAAHALARWRFPGHGLLNLIVHLPLILPPVVTERKDKMGFPTPFNDWARGPIRDFLCDTFSTTAARTRAHVDNSRVLEQLERDGQFGRNLWGLLSLELWQQAFHDRHEPFDADDVLPLATVGALPATPSSTLNAPITCVS